MSENVQQTQSAESSPAGAAPGPDVESSHRIRSAADAVRCAEAELRKARDLYEKVRREATERLQDMRKKTLGDLLDGTLEAVRKHPGPGVVVAGMIGFLVGRLFRR
jgi:ElaB/YqjD/DUF883 family membrane-anchored ribosome-binding protein